LRANWWVFWAVLSGCSRGESLQPVDGSADLQVPAAQAFEASAAATTSAPSVLASSLPRSSTKVAPPEAGASVCRSLGGPVQVSRRGASTLAVRGDEVVAVLNEDGHPALARFRVAPLAPGPLIWVPPPNAPTRAQSVPCAVTGDLAFCPDRTGIVRRSTLAGADSQWTASAVAGTRVSAARAPGSSAVLVYLARRQTSEGWVTEAWVVAEEGRPERLSEDGSGATSAALAARGSSLLAVTVDSRVALTAMHAREVRCDHGLQLSEDVVTFVGGPGAPGTAAALALFPSSSAGWALLPIAQDVSSFGVAAVRLDAPPQVDEPVLWSPYPDGLDPAAIATVAVGSRIWVARVRPRERGLGAPRLLEVGELATDGSFAGKHIVAGADGATDVALASDSRGALWIAWLDASGSWVERLGCP